uniref:Reverse transcriptase n=1 Tax=Ditylenchus dipsaci TaxID=166011 RepID=A0A915E9K7_9BILA
MRQAAMKPASKDQMWSGIAQPAQAKAKNLLEAAKNPRVRAMPLPKSAKVGLVRKYKEGKEFTRLFDQLKSLVYVPPLDVKEAFDEITRSTACHEDGSLLFPWGSPEFTFLNGVQANLPGSLLTHSCLPWNYYSLIEQTHTHTSGPISSGGAHVNDDKVLLTSTKARLETMNTENKYKLDLIKRDKCFLLSINHQDCCRMIILKIFHAVKE